MRCKLFNINVLAHYDSYDLESSARNLLCHVMSMKNNGKSADVGLV